MGENNNAIRTELKAGETRKSYLSARIDNLISRGFRSLILILAVAVLIVVFVGGLLYLTLTPNTEISFFEALWTAFAYTTNPELPMGEGTFDDMGYAILTLITVIIGLLITSALIGIITTALTNYYEGLKRGFSNVLLKNQTTILGYNENIMTFIEELCTEHNGESAFDLVIIDDKMSRQDIERNITLMMDRSLKQLKKKYKCNITCRNAQYRDISELNRCAVQYSKAIIVNDYDDPQAMKTLLAVSSLLRDATILKRMEESGQTEKPIVVCAFRDYQYARAGIHVGDDLSFRVVSLHDLLTKLIAKTCYQPRLTQIFSELVSFSGNEFHIISGDRFLGRHFDELIALLPSAIPVGIFRPDEKESCELKMIINFPDSVVKDEEGRDVPLDYREYMTIRPGDSLIVCANDSKCAEMIDEKGSTPKEECCSLISSTFMEEMKRSNLQNERKRILVLGYDETFDSVVINLARHYSKDMDLEQADGRERDVRCFINLLYRTKRAQRVQNALMNIQRMAIAEGFTPIITEVRDDKIGASGGSECKSVLTETVIGNCVVRASCVDSNYIDLKCLEKTMLDDEPYNHVTVLSDLSADREASDTETLLTLLYLHAIYENSSMRVYENGMFRNKKLPPFCITTEIQNIENRVLAYNDNVTDYIIGYKMMASIETQIAENRHMYKILSSLLDQHGPEIQLEPVEWYLNGAILGSGEAVDFDAIAQMLRNPEDPKDRRVLLGYLKPNDAEEQRVHLCPRRGGSENGVADGSEENGRMIRFSHGDLLIVIKGN